MSELLRNIDARTRLAGTNKLEILLFTLGVDARSGCRETYGINVFKVREVMRTPPITAAPEMPSSVEGMVSLRGVLVPVVDLAKYAGMSIDTPREIMIVTEYNGHTQGFLVEAVDTILRLDWSQMRVPPDMLTANLGGLVTAVTELPGPKLVMLLDVEKVLSEPPATTTSSCSRASSRSWRRSRSPSILQMTRRWPASRSSAPSTPSACATWARSTAARPGRSSSAWPAMPLRPAAR